MAIFDECSNTRSDLAKHLEITDQAQISAIEAASLLHDMGKLAVPEYILNKPGKLTPAEFERMKLHASIGADILSAIDFPYPVVPIVRHHHENWDGTGYPDGLRAQHPDRRSKYFCCGLLRRTHVRPSVSSEDGGRRCNPYSSVTPWVDVRPLDCRHIHCDTHGSRSTRARSERGRVCLGGFDEWVTVARAAPLTRAAAQVTTTARLDEIAASTEETLVLYDLAIGLTGHVDLGDVGDVIAKQLRRIVPASDIVFYVYNVQTDDLVSMHAAGSHASHLVGLRIPRGERLSGWVAANKQTIVNADPVLDLGEMARMLRPRLRSCISTPLVSGQDLIGVLTFYSVDTDAFNEDHKRILEIVGRQVSQTVRHALTFERYRATDFRDIATGLPNVRHLERMFAAASANVQPEDKVSVIFVTIRQGKHRHGNSVQLVNDRTIESVASGIRKALRGGDLLFRYDGNELAILLSQTDADTASLVADRTRLALATELSERHSDVLQLPSQ